MLVAVVVLTGLLLAVTTGATLSAAYVCVRLRAMAREAVTPAAEGELSPLAQVSQAVAGQLADCLMLRLKQSLSASATHISRQENAMQREMGEAAVQESFPQLGALMNLLPANVRKRVSSPAGMAALISLLGNTGAGTGTNQRSNGGKLFHF